MRHVHELTRRPPAAVVEDLFHDIRHAIRALRRSPGFAVVAIGTLAVGIGATVTMFSVADAVLIRPVSYRDPDEARADLGPEPPAQHSRSQRGLPGRRRLAGGGAVVRIDRGGGRPGTASLAGRGDAEVVRVARVNAELLPMLGARVAAGRTFKPDEDRPGGDPSR